MMIMLMRVFIGFWMVVLFSGCAGIATSRLEPPVVSLSSFKMLPQAGGGPAFEIGLHIINPNRTALKFEGIYYTVSVEGYDVLAGVSNDLPVVDAYGEADILLEASVDLLKSVRLITSLMQQPRDRFSYSFSARLDPGGLNPRVTIKEDGEFNLQN